MTLKKPNNTKTFEQTEVVRVNQNFDTLYANKAESRYKTDVSGVNSFIYQAMEHGEVAFSGTGSATVSRTFSLAERHNVIIYANAHARSPLVTAHVVDVTGTSITIECRSVSGTGNFSAVTTATVMVFWQVVGSSP